MKKSTMPREKGSGAIQPRATQATRVIRGGHRLPWCKNQFRRSSNGAVLEQRDLGADHVYLQTSAVAPCQADEDLLGLKLELLRLELGTEMITHASFQLVESFSCSYQGRDESMGARESAPYTMTGRLRTIGGSYRPALEPHNFICPEDHLRIV